MLKRFTDWFSSLWANKTAPKMMIRLKEGESVATILSHYPHAKINRLYPIAPKVNAYRLKHPDTNQPDDEVLFMQLIYPAMTPIEQKLYRTYSVGYGTENQPHTISSPSWIAKQQSSGIEYIQSDMPQVFYDTPNDPELAKAWGIDKINCTAAWDISRGAGITVAVIDTGVDHHHPDITLNMWEDDAGHHGINIVDNNYDTMDREWHGTHIAGIIGAVADNKLGIAGVAPEARIMAIKVFPAPTDAQLAIAIHYAVEHGARVINNSWGPKERRASNPVLSDVIDFACEVTAERPGAVVVCAAGNDPADDVRFYAPANHPKVITVASVRQDDTLARSSKYGAQVTVAAPGYQIHSLISDLHDSVDNDVYGYARRSGTSMAAGFVSGLAALVLSRRPELTPEQVKKLIRDHADLTVRSPIGVIPTRSIGGGRINAFKTLRAL